ncbi:phage-related minor tail protein [Rhizobium rosettiformans]|uniref:Phage tail tape measure protein n=2 Tax=Rhizobium rosettiformans TaxID=1368430 RepID=A0A4S8Q1T6_9HYPH|nr:phage tail tape measure protein [Rhizobium rosettiformans]MBB5274238.1 phage-related minor tail protein [Rhizobium rosettiformans]THV38117.1 phage tail tape measure protein [Rhizobium rosettiformans W3]
MTDDDVLDLFVDLDAGAALAVLEDLESRSASFGRALTSALRGATTGGKGLEEVLRSVGMRLTDIALSAGLKPLEGLLGDAAESVIGSLSAGFDRISGAGVTAYAAGGVPGRVMPFAEGGVVAAPTYFPMSGGMGLMGEAGAEAILPLKRGADGALGVAAEGGGGTTVIHFQVTASDAASFARSEGQITAMLARSVGRGRRGL